jgi:hypothetical protein
MPKTKDFDGMAFFVDFVKDKVGFVRDFPNIRTFGKTTVPPWKCLQGLSCKNQLITKSMGGINVGSSNVTPDLFQILFGLWR